MDSYIIPNVAYFSIVIAGNVEAINLNRADRGDPISPNQSWIFSLVTLGNLFDHKFDNLFGLAGNDEQH
jgi:hypothetical protein